MRYYPNNGENWVKLNFPEIRWNYINKIISNSVGNIFACTQQNGVYRSIDDGISWQNIDSGIVHSAMLDMTINNNGDLFVTDATYGIYRSTNNGNTWQILDTTNISNSIGAIAITKTGAVIASALSGDSIYRSIDNGNTWQKSYIPDYNITSFLILPDSSIITLGAIWGTYISIDDGINWSTLSATHRFGDIWLDANNILYGSAYDGMYQSTDNGITWTLIDPNLPGSKFFQTNSNDLLLGGGRNGMYKNDSTYFVSTNHHLQNDFAISIFPNPTSNYITINTTEKSTIEILNIQGQILKTIKSNEISTKIDVGNLPSGIYLIKATSSKGVGVKKFLKE